MRDCPRCHTAVDGEVCPSCGYGKKADRSEGAHNPNWWRCIDTHRDGTRCAKPGAFRESTTGGDQWYCYQHYPPFARRGYGGVAPPPNWADALKRIPKPIDYESEAERMAIQQEA